LVIGEIMATWGIARAKAQLSEVVHEAQKNGPQKISRSGREVAVVVSMEQWQQLQPKHSAPPPGVGSLYHILMNSPLRGSGVEFSRIRGKMRKIDL
jgi:prevent-host-death family protein